MKKPRTQISSKSRTPKSNLATQELKPKSLWHKWKQEEKIKLNTNMKKEETKNSNLQQKLKPSKSNTPKSNPATQELKPKSLGHKWKQEEKIELNTNKKNEETKNSNLQQIKNLNPAIKNSQIKPSNPRTQTQITRT